MTATAQPTHRGRRPDPRRRNRRAGRRRVLGGLVLALALVVAGYLAVTVVLVWTASVRDSTRDAQAIIVLGAAQYDGRPSPALQQRLDHAVTLYDDDVAPLLVVTGGEQPGDRFTEATAAASYLHQRGVPDAAIRREVHGRNTFEQLAASARFLGAEQVTDVVLVSHPMHTRRLELVAREVGLDATVSSTKQGIDLRQTPRETAAVAVGQLIGFRRLSNLTHG